MRTWTYDDGGRAAAGFKGDAGDCVTRAIAIAAQVPYREVYDRLWEIDRLDCEFRMIAGDVRGVVKARGPRNGVRRDVYDALLTELGWAWTPTMKVGQGCTVHARADELPSGRLILRLSKHLAAMIDGVIHDTHDPSRGGTRCVYGYWSR
jgi:hypothetical protein